MNFDISEITSHPWAAWLVLALVCGILEVALPYFTFSFAATAAAVAAGLAFKLDWVWQVGGYFLTLIVSLLVLRPRVLARLHPAAVMPSRAQALVGARGVIAEALDPETGSGRVWVEGQDWAARGGTFLAVNRAVEIVGHDGIVLIVKEI